MSLLFGPLLNFFWPIVVIGFIVFLVRQKPSQNASNNQTSNPAIYSKENVMSQLFIIAAVIFFGITLGTFNKYLGAPLSLYGVIITSILVALAVTYYTRIVSLGMITLAGLFFWWGNQSSLWVQADEIKSSVVVAGLLFISLILYVLGHTHKKNIIFIKMSYVYFAFGIICLSSLLLYFSSEKGVLALYKMMIGNSVTDSWQLILTLVIAFILIIGSLSYAFIKKLISPAEAISALFISVIGILIIFLRGENMFNSGVSTSKQLSSAGIIMAIVLNLALFLEILGLIFLGYIREETTWVNLGAFSLFFLIFIKYFDWFYDSFDKSLFFIGAGVLLLFTGWIMEKGRRYTLSHMKTNPIQAK
jgi:hypothetical protein